MQPRDVGGGGRLEGLELGAADEQVRKACSHEKMAAGGGSRVESLVLRTSRSARRAAREDGGGGLEGLELGAANEKAGEACSHVSETLAVEGGSRV